MRYEPRKRTIKPVYTQHIPIYDSSLIRSVSYDEKNRVLKVNFNLGANAQYLDVPLSTVIKLRTAESAGAFYNKEIKQKYDLL